MPEQTVTVNAYHPYPAFYWEVKPAGGIWAAIDDGNYSAYQGGQGTKEVTIDAIEGQQAVLRCTIGPLSAGAPVYGQAGTTTTDEIPVTVGALTWDVNPDGENVTIVVGIEFTAQPLPLEIEETLPGAVSFGGDPVVYAQSKVIFNG